MPDCSMGYISIFTLEPDEESGAQSYKVSL